MATWTLNSIRIVTQEKSDSNKQIIARLQPLSGGSINHIFGYESDSYKLNCMVVGTTDRDALKALTKSGSAYTLTTPYGNITVLVNDVTADQINSISQSILLDGSHVCTDPVFKVSIGLIT